jgi:hypothetical protein
LIFEPSWQSTRITSSYCNPFATFTSILRHNFSIFCYNESIYIS